ncbi:hypothetical protein E4U43_008463 [Claviceps pusilla]|uniref:Maleylacetoacetate isomerase n=1 Tax=Claviceps pusilla TaxID=123648 RepID=A0A9P7NAW7_9HYPO|nr:hypothetical protein E4U43_008463 [Claviceps pusilla]
MQEYTLHAYFRSSCSARLRIILHVKHIPYQLRPVNLLQDEHLSDEHRALNPSASVPLLVCPPLGEQQQHDQGQEQKDQDQHQENHPFHIGQSLPAMEYLEEQHPQIPILPPAHDVQARALVRTLCSIIATDIQPVTNLRIMKRVRALGGSPEDWNRDLMQQGLQAYEAVARGCAGRFSVGDSFTMADACLMPAVWNAERFGVHVLDGDGAFPTVARVVRNLSELEAVREAEYFRQPDCPEHLRR